RIQAECCPTVELTRRRESKHPSPHQASYETRSRRSRPTICYAATGLFDLPATAVALKFRPKEMEFQFIKGDGFKLSRRINLLSQKSGENFMEASRTKASSGDAEIQRIVVNEQPCWNSFGPAKN